jgi:hypothetical protein
MYNLPSANEAIKTDGIKKFAKILGKQVNNLLVVHGI